MNFIIDLFVFIAFPKCIKQWNICWKHQSFCWRSHLSTAAPDRKWCWTKQHSTTPNQVVSYVSFMLHRGLVGREKQHRPVSFLAFKSVQRSSRWVLVGLILTYFQICLLVVIAFHSPPPLLQRCQNLWKQHKTLSCFLPNLLILNQMYGTFQTFVFHALMWHVR